MTVVLDQPQELTWGSLVLDSQVPADVPWICETRADGSDLGNPVPLIEEVRSQLTDGSLSVVTGFDNREITFKLRLSATDGRALAQAEAAFMAEAMADRPADLVWTPPNLEAWPCVFDIVRVWFDRDYHDDWDIDERYEYTRDYTVTFTAMPWARDPQTVTIPALPVPVDPELPATRIVVDTCDSLSPWTANYEPNAGFWSSTSLAVENGAIKTQGTMQGGSAAPLALGLTRNGLVNMTGTPYLTLDVDTSLRSVPYVSDRITVVFDNSSTAVAPVAVTIPAGAPTPTTRRFYFEAPASFTKMKVRVHVTRESTPAVVRLWTYEVGRVDRIEVSGSSGFQIARTATVGGSAPTQASVRFDAGENPLVGSNALIYTGATPVVPMRAMRVSSAAFTLDPTRISGAENDLSAPMVFRIPVAQLREATFSLLARLHFTGSATVSWQARVVSSTGTTIPGSDIVVSGTQLLKNPTTDPWRIHEIAAIQMPVISIEGSTTHAVEITLSMASGGTGVKIDEGWLVDTDNGAVTVIHEPSAFQLIALELRSPQLDSPRPAVVGTWQTYGDQDISRLVTTWGTHLFEPGLLHVFTATDLGKYAECALEYFRRYHTHPGPPLSVGDAA